VVAIAADRRSGVLTRHALAELELTHEIPAQVRQACAGARRLASVDVICPRLIPDVPLTRSAGLWGATVFHDEPRFYEMTFNNGGLPGGKRHWITGGGEASVVEKWVLTDFMKWHSRLRQISKPRG
jgi:hypothetical protein